MADHAVSFGAADPPPSDHDEIAAEQVAALFSNVLFAVLGAMIGAAVLSVSLYRLGKVDIATGALWTGYIAACAFAHIVVRQFYIRANPRVSEWRRWAYIFTGVCLAEGIGWGWAPFGPAAGANFEVVLLIFVVVFGVAAGAMAAFGPYLPAFFAIFLPATIPYALANVGTSSPLEQAGSLLIFVFIAAVTALSATSNRSFTESVRLRLATQRMAAELRRQKEIAEQASLSKSTFLAAASHDLRQPVHALGLFVGALRAVSLPPEGCRLVAQIEASVTAMDGLFSALLDISRLDAGIVEVHRRAFAIGPVVNRICRDHRAEAESKGLALSWVRCGAVVDSDPVLTERIVRNLVSNAVRYTQSGGAIVVGCRRRVKGIGIQVLDTGPGIPPEQQERVFQEFYQIGNPERDRTKGLGLGLAIVRRLAKLLDAPLILRSNPGRGTCFELLLPIADRDSVQQVAGDGVGSLATGLVLVIDDEISIREAMGSLLAGWGHEVLTAASGDEAIRRLATCPTKPDLIISDLRLREEENGIDVIEKLRSEYNETIPAMLITGDTAPNRLIEAQQSGILLLHKPVPNSKLRAAIANLIRAAETEVS